MKARPQTGKRLIVSADDFGLHPAINYAVVEACRAGIVTSASLMPVGDSPMAFHDAVAMAEDTPGLDIGLHFALTGLPRLPSSYEAFLIARVAGQFPTSRIETMLHKQLDALIDAGVRPTHIDSHMNVHAIPSVMRAVCCVAKQYGIDAVRLPLDRTRERVGAKRETMTKSLALMSLIARKEIERHGLWCPELLGIAATGKLNTQRLNGLLDQIPQNNVGEIVCHPGCDNDALGAALSWRYDWAGELAAVTDPGIRDRIKREGITLTSFRTESRLRRIGGR